MEHHGDGPFRPNNTEQGGKTLTNPRRKPMSKLISPGVDLGKSFLQRSRLRPENPSSELGDDAITAFSFFRRPSLLPVASAPAAESTATPSVFRAAGVTPSTIGTTRAVEQQHGGEVATPTNVNAMALRGKMEALRRTGVTVILPQHLLNASFTNELKRTRARMTIQPLREPYIGAWMRKAEPYKSYTTSKMCDRQRTLQQLYETRFASQQRLVAFFVLFHAMAKRVQDFWPAVSFGLLGYDMSRSQSMLRVATTASPVSGAELRSQMVQLELDEMVAWAARIIQRRVRWNAHLRQRLVSMQQHLAFTQSGSQSGEAMVAAELVASLPNHYLISTSVDERDAHVELYRQYKQAQQDNLGHGTVGEVHLSWRRRSERGVCVLYLVFFDCVNSLSTIAAALGSRGINILRASVFSTRNGVAIDTIEVEDNCFDQDVATLIRARLVHLIEEQRSGQRDPLELELPESYVHGTTVDERKAHSALFKLYQEHRALGTPQQKVQMMWNKAGKTSVVLYLVYEDVVGSLGVITASLRESRVDIHNIAAYSTASGVAVHTIQLSSNFNDDVAQTLKANLASELELHAAFHAGTAEHRQTDERLLANMPGHYKSSTTPAERMEHLKLYNALCNSREPVHLSWSARQSHRQSTNGSADGTRRSVVVHIVFVDVKGSLATITTSLHEAGVSIMRVAAYVTSSNVAVDTFEVSAFDSATADLLRSRLTAQIQQGQASWTDIFSSLVTSKHTALPAVSGSTRRPESREQTPVLAKENLMA